VAAYYNENNPFAYWWLKALIKAGLIEDGEVDGRSIEDVVPTDLRGFQQCHFFAGIGVWSHALRQAGWHPKYKTKDHQVWTGSCPCQPFSKAGKGAGFADERHLWPAWFHLIQQCQPQLLLGEQVAHGGAKAWLDLVQSDLEAVRYSFGATVLCASGFGAPHARHRAYWVADLHRERRHSNQQVTKIRASLYAPEESQTKPSYLGAGSSGVGNPASIRLKALLRGTSQVGPEPQPSRPTDGFWRDADWLRCTDDKWRPVEPGTFPLAYGATQRVGRLRGYGNALVAPVATEFIKSVMDVLG
jgi:DNA (cytosine-5)-methyltransferase 1